MNDAFFIAATGMRAHQGGLDVIANNLVNANTPGFKKSTIAFSEIVSSSIDTQEMDVTEQVNSLGSSRVNSGVLLAGPQKQFDMGDLKKTDNPLDIAIRGEGFIEVVLPGGKTAYSRGGALKIGKDGVLMNASGFPLKAGVQIPENTNDISFSPDGKILIQANKQAGWNEVGQLNLIRFNNASSLQQIGSDLFIQTTESGDPQVISQGDTSTEIAQGWLEMSNVKMLDEMMNMMLAQRAYEASLKVLQAADEMSAMANNLRKG